MFQCKCRVSKQTQNIQDGGERESHESFVSSDGFHIKCATSLFELKLKQRNKLYLHPISWMKLFGKPDNANPPTRLKKALILHDRKYANFGPALSGFVEVRFYLSLDRDHKISKYLFYLLFFFSIGSIIC